MQLNHYTSKFTKQQFPIVLISDNVSHAANLGSLFRTADAFGIEHLILGGQLWNLGGNLLKHLEQRNNRFLLNKSKRFRIKFKN